MYSSNGGENPIHIYHLPNEILSEICLFATLPHLIPGKDLVGVVTSHVPTDAQQYRQLIAKELRMARVLRLVSQRFNRLATPLLFESFLLVQNKLSMTQRGGISEENMTSSPDGKVRRELGTIMEILRDLLSLKPHLRQHCKSLCLVYREKHHMDFNSSGMSDEGHSEEEIENGNGQYPEIHTPFPRSGILDDIYTWLVNVTDFQVHIDVWAVEMPNFSVALTSMPKLAVLRITGEVDYLSIFKQLVTVRPDSLLETLDLSNATANGYDYDDTEATAREVYQTLDNVRGTGSMTRLLTGTCLGTDVLTALVAWPRRLERLALQVDPYRITTHSPDNGSLQKILDSQKDSLTHLRIEGNYELGLYGFDLTDFSRLEQLALDTATMSNFNQFPRNKTIVPELDCRIFAPNLRSLLLFWKETREKIETFARDGD
ncbi:Ff.00g116790.m01.CDS01 [Fusarium sp. VM40]|nr:Ff.00g116790.m01.CDS01 [Fusarium sp. VM40]